MPGTDRRANHATGPRGRPAFLSAAELCRAFPGSRAETGRRNGPPLPGLAGPSCQGGPQALPQFAGRCRPGPRNPLGDMSSLARRKSPRPSRWNQHCSNARRPGNLEARMLAGPVGGTAARLTCPLARARKRVVHGPHPFARPETEPEPVADAARPLPVPVHLPPARPPAWKTTAVTAPARSRPRGGLGSKRFCCAGKMVLAPPRQRTNGQLGNLWTLCTVWHRVSYPEETFSKCASKGGASWTIKG